MLPNLKLGYLCCLLQFLPIVKLTFLNLHQVVLPGQSSDKMDQPKFFCTSNMKMDLKSFKSC